MVIRIEGPWFKDQQGRTLLLRGVNLAGSSKVPYTPYMPTHVADGFFNHREVSFVGRPFPLEAADEHFTRLRAWGFNFLRFLVIWEAVEHAGPGQYDTAYLDYVAAVVEKAADYGFHMFIDPHQDAWSRFSGGDGAPGWTFELAGLDITRFRETGAAVVHNTYGPGYPQMIWYGSNNRLAAATMWTLFFAGDDFAPQLLVEGEPVQHYLQRHYIAAVQQVAARVCHLDAVLGYDILNEPNPGYIGMEDLRAPNETRSGPAPTAWQTLLLGAGYPQMVENWSTTLPYLLRLGQRRLNPRGLRAWQEGRGCIWQQHGVWRVGAEGPELLRPDYFAFVNGRRVDFNQDYMRPFILRYAAALREVHPGAMIFVESKPFHPPPYLGDVDTTGMVYAPHWYDFLPLQFKRHLPFITADIYHMRTVLGSQAVRRSIETQLGRYRVWARERMHNAPTVIGEIGVPFDINGGRSYRTGDFSQQADVLDRSISAMEANLLAYTLWNYTPDNTNRHGDGWNGEDLSLYSLSQRTDPADINSGGRALEAVVRPGARAVAGEPLRSRFDRVRGIYELVFRHDPAVQGPTEIFVPPLQYPRGFRVEVSDGEYELDSEGRLLRYYHTPDQPRHRVRIMPVGPPQGPAYGTGRAWRVLGLLLALWLLRRALRRR